MLLRSQRLLELLSAGVLALLAPRLASQDAQPAPLFGPRLSMLEMGLSDGAFGDLDGDGILDVVHSHWNNDWLSVDLGSADGTWSGSLPLAAPDGPDELALADVDGDGHLDLVVEDIFEHRWWLYLGAGDGTFGPPLDTGVVRTVEVLEAADMDGDGDDDLVGANGGAVVVALAGPGPVLAQEVNVSLSGADRLVLVDATGDGVLDIVQAAVDGGVRLVEGTGGGAFGAPVLLDPFAEVRGLGVVDLDGDGVRDMVYLDSEAQAVFRLEGLGGGAFAPRTPLFTTASFSCPSCGLLSVGDLDGDGDPDLVVGMNQSLLAYNDGTGGFGQGTLLELALQPRHLLDVEGDGDLDLLNLLSFSGPATGAVAWLHDGSSGLNPYGVTTFPQEQLEQDLHALACSADLDGDGRLDVVAVEALEDELQVFLGQGGGALATPLTASIVTSSPVALGLGDLDQDGTPDVILAGEPFSGSTGLEVSLVDGSGAPGPVNLHPMSSPVRTMVLGDVDTDGIPDVVQAHHAGASLHRGDGAGGLLPEEALDGAEVRAASLADLDGDGLLDLQLVRANPSALLEVLAGDGTGAFLPAGQVALGTAGELPPRPADMDLDGDLDLVLRVGWAAGSERVLLGDGALGLTPAPGSSLDVPVGLPLADVADLDRDGWPDVVWGSGVAFGRGDGGFDEVEQRWHVFSLRVFEAVDMDGDLRPDLLGAASDLAVLHNREGDPWLDLGGGKPGARGQPRLRGQGELVGGAPVGLRLTEAAPGSPATLVLGLSLSQAPFKGGTLVPSPDVVLAGAATDAEGDLLLPFAWPQGVPAGTEVTTQWWVVDGAATLGLSASNGLLARAP